MNYDSDGKSDGSNPIIGFKKAQNKTSTEYRTNFALDAAHLMALRTLCNHVSGVPIGVLTPSYSIVSSTVPQ